MLTVAKQKLIQSLQHKKFRIQNQLFVIEGVKIITEFISRTNLISEIFTINDNVFDEKTIELALNKEIKITIVDEKLIKKISSLTTPQSCIAIANIISNKLNIADLKTQKTIALDNIQDPGNLGTIIRTADWFGIKNIVCSSETVDCYNPKVVQATMGSLSNVNVFYTDLNLFLEEIKKYDCQIYGAVLNGISIKNAVFNSSGVLLLGNEANGITEKNMQYITYPITIQKSETAFAESLNVSIANAICCHAWVGNNIIT